MITGDPIVLPCIPEFLTAIGYPMEKYPGCNLVAVFWGAGDEAYYSNGMITATGEYEAYLLYLDNFYVITQIQEDKLLLGSSEEPASHYLLIDIAAARGRIIPDVAARAALMGQWEELEFPKQQIITIPDDPGSIQGFLDDFAAGFREIFISNDDIQTQMREHDRKMQVLRDALNNYRLY
jgi:hypothetical protein